MLPIFKFEVLLIGVSPGISRASYGHAALHIMHLLFPYGLNVDFGLGASSARTLCYLACQLLGSWCSSDSQACRPRAGWPEDLDAKSAHVSRGDVGHVGPEFCRCLRCPDTPCLAASWRNANLVLPCQRGLRPLEFLLPSGSRLISMASAGRPRGGLCVGPATTNFRPGKGRPCCSFCRFEG